MKIRNTREDIKLIIWNSLDLCGSWRATVKDYCVEEMLEFNSEQIQSICFDAVSNYGKPE